MVKLAVAICVITIISLGVVLEYFMASLPFINPVYSAFRAPRRFGDWSLPALF
jgi:hypothetical protein